VRSWLGRTLMASAVCLAISGPATAANLFSPGNWAALASDRPAEQVGDSLTVLVYEASTASNTTQRGAKRSTRLDGQIADGGGLAETGRLDLNSDFQGGGQTGRTGKMVAQISVVVTEVLANGDLRVTGEQVLNINGERTRIKIQGRVRRGDISNANTVLSSRLAEAVIDYDGSGFVSRSSKPGILGRIFNWLGLL